MAKHKSNQHSPKKGRFLQPPKPLFPGLTRQAVLLHQQGMTHQAESLYRQAIIDRPQDLDAWHYLGVIRLQQVQLAAASRYIYRALIILPEHPDAWSNLGVALRRGGESSQAEGAFRRALILRPDYADAYSNYARAIDDQGRAGEARLVYQLAILCDPQHVEAANNLGMTYQLLGEIEQSLRYLKQALVIRPDYVEAYNNLGNTLNHRCQLTGDQGSLAQYHRALRIRPNYSTAQSNLLFAKNYQYDITQEALFEEYRQAGKRLALPQTAITTHDPAPDRPLRVGYLSPDFRQHAGRHFIQPLLSHHTKKEVIVYAYAEVKNPDEHTRHFQTMVSYWRNIVGASDEAVVNQIRKDKIDILVDLAGHTADNRLAIFARKPAPIQISWLGYGYTTGLATIDYFLADPYFVPQGYEHLFSEKILRLPQTLFCYHPPETPLEITPLPALSRGEVTFGCFTRTIRLNERVLHCWAKILAAIPRSRLFLNSKPFNDPETCRLFQRHFADYGIDPKRLTLIYTSPQSKTWATYGEIDIALDPFPHNAGTTTFEALWMGVPVISMRERPPLGRFGATILANVGLSDWVADHEEDYQAIAVRACQDLPALAQLRQTLRQQMLASPLCDAPTFAKTIEKAYRLVWRKHLESLATTKPGSNGTDSSTRTKGNEKDQIRESSLRLTQGLRYYQQKNYAEALREAEEALHRGGDKLPEAWALYGILKRKLGQESTALLAYRAALVLDPAYADGFNNLGNLLRDCNQLTLAILAYQRGILTCPTDGNLYHHLGLAYQERGEIVKAVDAQREALIFNPSAPSILCDLGAALQIAGRNHEAVGCFRCSLNVDPLAARTLFNLGFTYQQGGRLGDAITHYHAAIAIRPEYHEAYNNLGTTLHDRCELDRAVYVLRRALTLKPDYRTAHGNILFCINYHPDYSPEAIFAEYRYWNSLHSEPLRRHAVTLHNSREPTRKLRIGYFSPDLSSHACHYFLEPLLAHHRHDLFEIFAYSAVLKPDAVTQAFKQSYFDHWRDVLGLSDEACVKLIQQDQIDILVDLAGHTGGGRLEIFSYKPAPIQISWLGYGYTTGLSTIDYFFADHHFVPEGFEHLFSEAIYRLPQTLFCYRPPKECPDIQPPPVIQGGKVTFGCFSRTIRFNRKVIQTWAEILKSLPQAQMLFNSKPFVEKESRTWLWEEFARFGVGQEQIILEYSSPPWDSYQQIDIALDPFPHNAGTTTFESLWMGVPVISLADRVPLGRFGATILSNLGMADWLAETPQDYCQIALRKAADKEGLIHLRSTLRERMLASPLGDEKGFALAVESAYRDMWQRYCRGEQPSLGGDGISERARAIVTDSSDQTIQATLEYAIHAYRQGNFTVAMAKVQMLLQVTDQIIEVWTLAGILYRRHGQKDQAVTAYQCAIGLDPASKDAYHNLANLYQSESQPDLALFWSQRVLVLAPEHTDTLMRCGVLYHQKGQWSEAVSHYRKLLTLSPNHLDGCHNLAQAYSKLKQLPETVAAYRHTIALKPDHATAYLNLGGCQRDLGKLADALLSYRNSIVLDPGSYHPYMNLGVILQEQGELQQAIQQLNRAVQLDLYRPDIYMNLATSYQNLRLLTQAAYYCQLSLILKPDQSATYNNLGRAFQTSGNLLAAMRYYQCGLSITPDDVELLNNLGITRLDLNQFEAAINTFQQAMAYDPNYYRAHSNLLFGMNYHPEVQEEALFGYYQAWEKSYIQPRLQTRSLPRATPSWSSGQPLRVGYFSPDFREHACVPFLEPLLAHHNRKSFEIFAYSAVIKPDAVTERFRKKYADHWRSVVGLSDEDFYHLVQKDNIHILVDLAGHTSGGRLELFAHQPAPVQISWLGYGYTTGLTAIDYFFADPYFIPKGSEHLFSETIYRLPQTVFCYRPVEGMPEVHPLPALSKGFVTFGCFSRTVRFNEKVLQAWASILRALPEAQLRLNNKPFVEAEGREWLWKRFHALGIKRDRILLEYDSPPWESYHKIDIALDPFPHNAGTTTFESLWMGVPVISLKDRVPLGRFGATILTNVGLEDWLASDQESYCQLAVNKGQDIAALAQLRFSLRARMQNSPLRDEKTFAHTIEQAYHTMWHRYRSKVSFGVRI